MMLRMLILLLALPAVVRADVKLHPLFSDNMVLQRNAKVTIWGSADPGEKVSISYGFFYADNKGQGGGSPVTVDDKGNWSHTILTGDATENVKLSVKGKNEITLKNVAIGDVWLCSGQSNMEWKLSQLTNDDQGKKVAAAAKNPKLRMFIVPNRPFPTPQKDFPVTKSEGCWLECTPETVIGTSAVGYFFGRDIAASQNVPVGLLQSDWGGTPAQAWTSKAGLETEPVVLKGYLDRIASHDEAKVMAAYEKALEGYKKAAEKAKAEGKPVTGRMPTKPTNGGVDPHFPAALYNGMIAPITNYKIKGAIWYQGESNAGVAKEYRTLFPTMIKDWRKAWGEDFPFFCVQLAPFKGGGSGVDYAELRDAQTFAMTTLPKCGIAIITDVGHETDIHPQRKEPVGQRLALAARAVAYGEKVEYQGPTFAGLKVEGEKAIVTFAHAEGLMAKGDAAAGFAVCGEDKVFHPAAAKIDGTTVTLTSDKVTRPVAVRYGWVNFAKPELNVFNKAGLPAVPFRTDDFPLTTK